MEELIEALQIFSKYTDTKWPTHCEHDVMYVMVDNRVVSTDDTRRLSELGFEPMGRGWEEVGDYFYSYKYGSA